MNDVSELMFDNTRRSIQPPLDGRDSKSFETKTIESDYELLRDAAQSLNQLPLSRLSLSYFGTLEPMDFDNPEGGFSDDTRKALHHRSVRRMQEERLHTFGQVYDASTVQKHLRPFKDNFIAEYPELQALTSIAPHFVPNLEVTLRGESQDPAVTVSWAIDDAELSFTDPGNIETALTRLGGGVKQGVLPAKGEMTDDGFKRLVMQAVQRAYHAGNRRESKSATTARATRCERHDSEPADEGRDSVYTIDDMAAAPDTVQCVSDPATA